MPNNQYHNPYDNNQGDPQNQYGNPYQQQQNQYNNQGQQGGPNNNPYQGNNNPYGNNQGCGPNQPYGNNQPYNPNQGYSPNQGPNQGYQPNNPYNQGGYPPNYNQGYPQKPASSNKTLFIILGVIAVLAIAILVYFFVIKKDDPGVAQGTNGPQVTQGTNGTNGIQNPPGQSTELPQPNPVTVTQTPEQTLQILAEGIEEANFDKMMSVADSKTQQLMEQGGYMDFGGMGSFSKEDLTTSVGMFKEMGLWPESITMTVDSISPQNYQTTDIIKVNSTMSFSMMGATESEVIPLEMAFENGKWLITTPQE